MNSRTQLSIAIALVLGAFAVGTAFIVASPTCCTAAGTPSADVVDTATVSAFNDAMKEDGVRLIDVRTADEFNSGHIEGASNIDFFAADFREQIATLDKNAKYAIYCRTGNRSSQALEIMQELGFTQVIDLDGGVVAWQSAGLPLVTN